MSQDAAAKVAYSLAAAALALDVSVNHLRTEIYAGRLAAKKVGRGYRIGASELQRWYESLPDA